ncbi:helix-turn-helix domain-containing protein [Glycomyces sp. NPDC047369]
MPASPRPEQSLEDGASTPGNDAETPAQPRRRDSARTRQRLLDAARRRFAQDGYAGTPVREIAEEAGVNVALIKRYFESKEGLFAACLAAAVEGLSTATADLPPDSLAASIAGEIAGEGHYEHLLLLVRASGDERADEIRVDVLRSYAQNLAVKAGWREDDVDDDRLLRAQLVLSTAIGVVLLRSSGLRPLAATSDEDLITPLRALVETLLFPS